MAGQEVFLVSAARTPIGAFLGELSTLSASELGAIVIKGVLERSGIPADTIDEVLMGCVLPAGQGQAPARQAMLKAGIPNSVGATTLNKVCGSGLKAVMMGCSQIKAGEADLVIAGGMESMSQVPHYLKSMRTGAKMGNQSLIDGMIHDGLWDPYNDFHMGTAAEQCVQKYQFSREAQDDYSANSYKKSLKAVEDGVFKAEIAPVSIPQRKGPDLVIDRDEQPFKGDASKLAGLRPAFQKEGTITAGNASSLNDGASAVLLASAEAVSKYNLKPMAKILGSATFSQDPAWFTTAPVGAVQKLLAKLGLTVDEIDLYEVNEAFAAVVMAAITELKLPEDRVNVRGGAVSLGHPIGSSGARILTTLAYALRDLKLKRGLATLCIGGGEAVALVIEAI